MEEKKTIIVKFSNVCGRDLYYPHNEIAKTILSMSKTTRGDRKTFTEEDLIKLESLDYTIKILRPRIVYDEDN